MRLPIFHGWLIIAVAFVTMGIGVNARTAFSLLLPPILQEFGWERCNGRRVLVRLSRLGGARSAARTQ
jgi:hypothetical protein